MTQVLSPNTCGRCKRNPKEPGKSRCGECLAYARTWQKKKTKVARKEGKCITCGSPSENSRCDKCTERKSDSYFRNKGGESPQAIAV